MEQEEAISKIKKLLRLSESPNENEAQVALKKARELMLQYHVSEGSLDEQDKETIWKEVEVSKNWMHSFYTLISHNNRCDCYQQTYYKMVNGKAKKMRKIYIVGYPFDVECVIVMGQMVEDAVKHGIAKFRESVRFIDSNRSTEGVTSSYVYGFRKGLEQAFAEQNAKEEFHLMCITPQEVKNEMDNVPNLRRSCQTIKLGYSSTERSARERGTRDGYETGKRKQIGGEA